MDKKQTSNYAIQKTNKCPLNTGKEPEKKGNPENNGPEPELRPCKVPTIVYILNFVFNID